MKYWYEVTWDNKKTKTKKLVYSEDIINTIGVSSRSTILNYSRIWYILNYAIPRNILLEYWHINVCDWAIKSIF